MAKVSLEQRAREFPVRLWLTGHSYESESRTKINAWSGTLGRSELSEADAYRPRSPRSTGGGGGGGGGAGHALVAKITEPSGQVCVAGGGATGGGGGGEGATGAGAAAEPKL